MYNINNIVVKYLYCIFYLIVFYIKKYGKYNNHTNMV